MRWRSWFLSILAVFPAVALAQAPQYTPVFLGNFAPVGLNARGEVLGATTVAGAQRGLVTRAGQPFQLLPLPGGMGSSLAVDISDAGLIVGAVAAGTSPEFGGRAALWTPDGSGGYTVTLLDALPGQSISRATAVNDAGDIVGYSSDGTYRYPVWFTSPTGVMNLSATGIFDPVDINERHVLVDQSFTTRRLDLTTMVAEDLGAPPPGPFGGHYIATRAAAINESGQVAAAAILATSTSCDREPARYDDGAGWEVFAGCGPYNSALDVNDRGDVTMSLYLAPFVRLEGLGTFPIQDLIATDAGTWYAATLSGASINNSRQIVIRASNPTTGQSGALLLDPATTTGAPAVSASALDAGLRVTAGPNPFRGQTMIRYELPATARVAVTVHDIAGRRVRSVVAPAHESAGPHAVMWNGHDDQGLPLSSGVYFCVLRADGRTRTNRIVIAR